MIPISDEYFEVESCLYKLYYGNRYLIVKAKTLSGSVYLIERGYAAFMAAGGGIGRDRAGEGQKQWDGTNTYYFKFYTYLHKNPHLIFKIEILLETNNAYQLLKKEYQELRACIRDNKCLNSNVTSYIPKFNIKTNMYGWIPKRNVADFRRFLSR